MNSQVYIPNSDPILNSKLLFPIIYSVSLLINPSYFTRLEQSIWSSPPPKCLLHRQTSHLGEGSSIIPASGGRNLGIILNPVFHTCNQSICKSCEVDSVCIRNLTTALHPHCQHLGVSHPHLSPGLWPYPSEAPSALCCLSPVILIAHRTISLLCSVPSSGLPFHFFSLSKKL